MIASSDPTAHFADLCGVSRRNTAIRQSRNEVAYTYNARGALFLIGRSLLEYRGDSGSRVLVPGFHCPTVVEPFIRAGLDVEFYAVNDDLTIDDADLSAKLSDDVAAVVVINYCGVRSRDAGHLLELKQQHDFIVIEDCAHSFLTGTAQLAGDIGDVAVFSFYKIVPSVVGGGFKVNDTHLRIDPPLKKADWRCAAVVLKRSVEQSIENSRFSWLRSLYHRLESVRVERKRARSAEKDSMVPAGMAPGGDRYGFDQALMTSKMPGLSRSLLGRADVDTIVTTRRRNYDLIDRNLDFGPAWRRVLPSLPSDACPWAYPLLIDNRSEVDRRLRARGVPLFTFGETLHSSLDACADVRTREIARSLSETLLLLPVHQQLDSDLIGRMCVTINDFFAETMSAAREEEAH